MQRLKRENNPSTYRIETERAIYAVTMEKLKNTNYGQPRYSAIVITLQVKGEPENIGCYYTRKYKWIAATYSDYTEAVTIVDYIESNLINEN